MTAISPLTRLTAAAALAGLLGAPLAAFGQETGASGDAEPPAGSETAASGTAGETAGAEGDPDGTGLPQAPEPAADPLEGLTAHTVIATVGDYELTLGEVISVRQKLPAQYQSLPPDLLMTGLFEQLVSQTALAVAARKAGIEDRADMQISLKNLVNSTLADTYMRETLAPRLTPERLREAYEERYSEPVTEINAAHILLETLVDATVVRASLEAAGEGADFAAAAKEHSTGPSGPRGGDLGWFVATDMVPEFSEAAFALDVGEISDPVQTTFGWHLIYVKEKRDRPAPPFEEVQEEIFQSVAETEQQRIVAEARSELGISYPDPAIPPEALMADELITAPPAE